MKLAILFNPARTLDKGGMIFVVRTAKTHGYDQVEFITTPKVRKPERFRGNPDLIMAIGGDGTVLTACHLSRGSGCPVVGINTGHVGFLTAIGAAELRKELPGIFAGKVRTETRLGIKVEFGKAEAWGMNDIILHGRDGGLFEAEMKSNGQNITTYKSDGLVVATPTGSSAYNLSLGGPLLAPTLEVLVITPLAPLSLLNRSIVVPSSDVMTLSVKRPIAIEADSRPVGIAHPGTLLRIHRSATGVPLQFLADRNHYDALGKRIGWNTNTIPEKP